MCYRERTYSICRFCHEKGALKSFRMVICEAVSTMEDFGKCPGFDPSDKLKFTKEILETGPLCWYCLLNLQGGSTPRPKGKL